MKVIGEGYTRQRRLGEGNAYKCSECGAEYLDISEANACQAKHFDDRQKKRKAGPSSLSVLDAPSIRTGPKISIKKTAASLPPEDTESIPVLTTRNAAINIAEDDENDLQKLADRLMEQYK